jgi:hypothetical protein
LKNRKAKKAESWRTIRAAKKTMTTDKEQHNQTRISTSSKRTTTNGTV